MTTEGTTATFTSCGLVGIERVDPKRAQKSCAPTSGRRGGCQGRPGLTAPPSPPGPGTLCPFLLRAPWRRAAMCPLRQAPGGFFQAWELEAPRLLSSHCPHLSAGKLRVTPPWPGLSTPSLELAAPRDSRKGPGCPASHSWAVWQVGV